MGKEGTFTAGIALSFFFFSFQNCPYDTFSLFMMFTVLFIIVPRSEPTLYPCDLANAFRESVWVEDEINAMK